MRLLASLLGFSMAIITALASANIQAQRPSADLLSKTLQVYKSPTCGCCEEWMNHMQNNGFNLTGHHPSALTEFKLKNGIELRYQSCHTAKNADGFVFEGHIPAKYISQFLSEPPQGAIGLAVPGMPLGSPGMEVGDRFSPYQVLLLRKDGTHEIYAQIDKASQQQ